MMPLMGLTLTYAHTHTSTLTKLTHEQHTDRKRTDSGGEIDATVRRNKQTQSAREKGLKRGSQVDARPSSARPTNNSISETDGT